MTIYFTVRQCEAEELECLKKMEQFGQKALESSLAMRKIETKMQRLRKEKSTLIWIQIRKFVLKLQSANAELMSIATRKDAVEQKMKEVPAMKMKAECALRKLQYESLQLSISALETGTRTDSSALEEEKIQKLKAEVDAIDLEMEELRSEETALAEEFRLAQTKYEKVLASLNALEAQLEKL